MFRKHGQHSHHCESDVNAFEVREVMIVDKIRIIKMRKMGANWIIAMENSMHHDDI